jgi:hypothetical protein
MFSIAIRNMKGESFSNIPVASKDFFFAFAIISCCSMLGRTDIGVLGFFGFLGSAMDELYTGTKKDANGYFLMISY